MLRQISLSYTLLIALAGCSLAAHEAGPNYAPNPKSLTCFLRNVAVLPSLEFRLDFVLQNGGPSPIHLWERWNSWGARQWRIRVSDSAGNVRVFVNPLNTWFGNRPTTFELVPGKEQVFHCALINREYRTTATGELNGLQIFVGMPENFSGWPPIDIRAEHVPWHSPVTLLGIFQSTESDSDAPRAEYVKKIPGLNRPDWYGQIETPPIKIDLPKVR